MEGKHVRNSMELVPYDEDMGASNASNVRNSMALVALKRPTNKIAKNACLELDKIKLDRA